MNFNEEIARLGSSDKGIAKGEFGKLQYFGIVGNASYIQSISHEFVFEQYNVTDVSGLANLSETTKQAIDKLFNKAKDEWRDIFDDNDKIKLTDTHLSTIVADLQEYKLMGSDLQVIDDAFEYLIPDVAKGKKGQYFTPRHVIDMCVKMLNPKKDEFVIDTACGSGGFLIHTMKYVNPKNFSKYASGLIKKSSLAPVSFMIL